jgi:hypothetical protein
LIARPTVQCDDVEAHRNVPELPMPSDKERGGSEELVLLAPIDGFRRRGKTRRLAIPDFDEHETSGIPHDEIDLTAAATEVPGDEIEPPGLEVFERHGLRVLSY